MAHTLFTSDLLLAILALFLPPLPVGIKCGFWTWQVLLDVVLMLFGGIPATIYAWYLIVKYPDDGIPFFDTRRGTYEIIPDASDIERQAGSGVSTPPPQLRPGSAASAPLAPKSDTNGTFHDNHNGSAQAGPSDPPPYDGQGHEEAAGANNKVQFNDDI